MKIYDNLHDSRRNVPLENLWNSKTDPPKEEEIFWLLNHLDRNLDNSIGFPSISDVSIDVSEKSKDLLSLWWGNRKEGKLLALDIHKPWQNSIARLYGRVAINGEQDPTEELMKDLLSKTNVRFRSEGGDSFTFNGEVNADDSSVWRREISGALRVLKGQNP